LNKKKLVGLEILKMGGNNEKGNKTFVRNNE
jgi:hypothetical protein